MVQITSEQVHVRAERINRSREYMSRSCRAQLYGMCGVMPMTKRNGRKLVVVPSSSSHQYKVLLFRPSPSSGMCLQMHDIEDGRTGCSNAIPFLGSFSSRLMLLALCVLPYLLVEAIHGLSRERQNNLVSLKVMSSNGLMASSEQLVSSTTPASPRSGPYASG